MNRTKNLQTVSQINMNTLKRSMDTHGLDLLLAVSPENFFYLTGTLLLSQTIIPERLCIAIFPQKEPPAAVVCYLEEPQTRQDSWITDIHTYLEYKESPLQTLADLLKKKGFGTARIGIELNFLAARYVQELAVLLPEATLVRADPVFEATRAIKTSTEIQILSEAALHTEMAIVEAFQAAKSGHSEKMVANNLSIRVLNKGATSHWITLATGSNTAINHPHPSSKPLIEGEILRVDVGGVFQGYQSDVARTATVGVANKEQRSVYQRLREAQRETITAARPGVRACDLYLECKTALARRGLSMTSQAAGHGLGIGLHEFPILHAQEKSLLKPGMVLNIEPAVVDSQGFLYHLEDLFLVTEEGPRILTTFMDTEDLFSIPSK